MCCRSNPNANWLGTSVLTGRWNTTTRLSAVYRTKSGRWKTRYFHSKRDFGTVVWWQVVDRPRLSKLRNDTFKPLVADVG